MKKSITIAVSLLLLAMTLLLLPGCGADTETTPSESNRWLELLSVIPEKEDTLKAAYMQTAEYVDLLREQWESSEDTPEGILEYVDLAAHRRLPLFGTAYTDEEWKETVGFTVKDVIDSIVAGVPPLRFYQAVRGRFSEADVEDAARTGPLNEHLETLTYGGNEYYSWGADFSIQFDWRSGVRNLGRGHRLAYVGDFAFWILWTEGLEEMIDSHNGKVKSLADNEDYIFLAGVLEDMDTVTAFFSSDSLSISQFKERFQKRFEELRDEGHQQQVEEFENEPLLKPYLSVASGAGKDEQGTYLVIVLVNTDESTARANAELLERRLNESLVTPYMEGVKKWTDGDRIESMEISSQGRLTVAKLYGAVYTSWDKFDPARIYLPLLLHE